MEAKSIVDIKCPRCSKKSRYTSDYTVYSLQRVPKRQGKVSCKYCGFNSLHSLESTDYFYSFSIKDRIFYAWNREHLVNLLNYFEEDKRILSDPELDFPKIFYQNRLYIIKKIKELLLK